MSTPNQPANTGGGNYHIGGTLTAAPQPDEPIFPLRCDQFLTLRDGEMSVSRSFRDACMGAFATGVFAIAGILLTIDWDAAKKLGKHPLLWTVILCTVTGVAFLVGAAEWIRIWQTQSRSTYSRLVEAIAQYFKIEPHSKG